MLVINMDQVGPAGDSFEHIFEGDALKRHETAFSAYMYVLENIVPKEIQRVVEDVVMDYVAASERMCFENGLRSGAQLMNKLMNERRALHE